MPDRGWYREVGQGMGPTLNIAAGLDAYVLTDRATWANFKIAGVLFKGSPEVSWRYVFLCGLIPAAVAFVVRIFVREPERWKQAAQHAAPPRLRELFEPAHRAVTLSGFSMALIALVW